ncbi:MAG TPA: VWA domain-containing protein [Gammaproteobacteria bacterium]|nr:VWA domain-containing protein [Gammaproteobacteria bacterium]
MRSLTNLCAAALLLLPLACTQTGGEHARAVYVLLDVSGTYSTRLDAANPVINYLLGTLVSGDSLTLASIDSASFSERNIISQVTFDARPSVANEQKRALRKRLDAFLADLHPSAHTDVSGAVLQAAQYLHESGAGHRYILIFSDLEQDLPKGYVRKAHVSLSGTKVVAMDVTKLHSDNVNPQLYLDRLAYWKNAVTTDGGEWQVVNDMNHLDRVFHD